jgi:hypothetical protein
MVMKLVVVAVDRSGKEAVRKHAGSITEAGKKVGELVTDLIINRLRGSDVDGLPVFYVKQILDDGDLTLAGFITLSNDPQAVQQEASRGKATSEKALQKVPDRD